jgi:hypothetical protein
MDHLQALRVKLRSFRAIRDVTTRQPSSLWHRFLRARSIRQRQETVITRETEIGIVAFRLLSGPFQEVRVADPKLAQEGNPKARA